MVTLAYYTWVMGVLNLWGGAAKDSRYYAVDNIVVRVLGGALLVLGAGVLMNEQWAVLPLAGIYAISLVEVIVTRTKPFALTLIAAVLLYGVPLLYLLQRVYR